MKEDKRYKLLILALVCAGLIISVIFIVNNKKKTVQEDLNITVRDLPLRIEATPVNFNIVNTPEGNTLECVYRNDSTEDISRLTLQVKLKDTGEIVQLSCNEPVEAGKESVKFTGKGPASGNIADVEILKYKISTRNGVYMEYDTELNQYNWS